MSFLENSSLSSYLFYHLHWGAISIFLPDIHQPGWPLILPGKGSRVGSGLRRGIGSCDLGNDFTPDPTPLPSLKTPWIDGAFSDLTHQDPEVCEERGKEKETGLNSSWILSTYDMLYRCYLIQSSQIPDEMDNINIPLLIKKKKNNNQKNWGSEKLSTSCWKCD